ncbi:MAG: class A beta-lactamase-related serine hydrolase [Lysobacteraceae bacterium]|nr:MAG: class A beta-lactamase-related serine hydrolase [Xanthomonadaceae bacterium]
MTKARRRSTAFMLSCQTGLVALLLPLAAGLSAQQQPPGAYGSVYSPRATMARVYPGGGLRVMPPATGFDVREFEAQAQSLVTTQKIPGLAMAIVQGGQVLSARGYGVTDVHQPEMIDAHTVFRLASLSKSFASTVTGMMVAEGSLRWDTRVIDYYPTLQFSHPDAAWRLSVADVLSHRVGVSHNAFDRDLERDQDYYTLVRKLADTPMQCWPGECYAYQNIAYSLIGDVITGASGQPFEEVVARRLFKPLGMHDASYGLEGIAASKRWAKPHVHAGRGWTSLHPKPNYYWVAPAAGVNASISDMTQWLLAQSGYRPDVLSGSLLATLHSPLIDTPSELRGSKWRRDRLNSAGYGLGWRIFDYAGHRLVYHGGAVQGYRGVIALMPERDLGVVVLWNSTSSAPSGLLPAILDRAIGIHPQPWIESESDPEEGLYAQRPSGPSVAVPQAQVQGQTQANDGAGVEASVSNANPH